MTAQEKIFCVLSKIKDQIDLMPKSKSRVDLIVRNTIGPCGIDFYELENILEKIKEEGFLENFSDSFEVPDPSGDDFYKILPSKNFNNLYEKYDQMLVNNQKKNLQPVAIKVQGKLKKGIIEDNISVGGGLLEAEKIEDSSIKGNKSFLFSPKGNIQKIEIIEGNKIEQHGEKNKIQTKNIKKINLDKKLFSMDNPIIWIIATLITATVIYYFFTK